MGWDRDGYCIIGDEAFDISIQNRLEIPILVKIIDPNRLIHFSSKESESRPSPELNTPDNPL